MTALRDRKRKCQSCDGEGCSACGGSGKKPTRLSLETDVEIRYRGTMRPIIVEPGPFYCKLRLKGTQLGYEVSWESMFIRGAALFAERQKRERKEARKNRKAGAL